MWKERVTSVSDTIFPGLSNYNSTEYDNFIKIGNEVLSHLPLQVSLYFNVVFFPFWLLSMFMMLPYKINCLTGFNQFILVSSFSAVILLECIRLYMGYVGNLKEKIPEIAGFWLVSILLQTPLQTFILFCTSLKLTPLEIITQTIMCIFLFSQLIFGSIALRHSAKHSVQAFHLSSIHVAGKYK